MKLLLFRTTAILLIIAALIYATDYVSLRYRIPGERSQFGTVSVREMYVIHEKNNKTEYQFTPPQDQACVYSLFPHFGDPPCWYLQRHTQQRIDI